MLFEIEYGTLLFYNMHYHLWGLAHQLLDWEKIYFLCMKRCERQESPRRYVADSQYFFMPKKTIAFSKYVCSFFICILILLPRKGLENL
jgi:hypothetical protein